MPTTTNINHTVDQQQRQPPLEPLLQHLLDIHCHLTNQTCPPARHNPLAIRLPPCVTTVHAEPKRYSRSMTQHFYIIDSPSRRLQLPVIHLIGNTGNLYTVSFTLSGVSCNCPDTTTYCKHILFLLFVSGMMASPKTPFYLNMESTINQLRTYDLSNHMLDATTNSICYRSITLSCTVCKKPIRREFFICSKCYAVSHKACGKRKIGTAKRRHLGDEYDSDRHGCSIPTPSLCFTCHKPWMPFTIRYSGKYRNIHGVLKHFQYPIAVPAGTTTPVTSTCFSSGNDSKSNIPRFRSSNTNHCSQLHRMNDPLLSAKRRLTYCDSGSTIPASVQPNSTFICPTACPSATASPSSTALHHQRVPTHKCNNGACICNTSRFI